MSSNNDAVNPHPPGDDTTSGEATQVSPVATSGNIDDAGTNCDQIKSWKGWVELENDPVFLVEEIGSNRSANPYLGHFQYAAARMGSPRHPSQ